MVSFGQSTLYASLNKDLRGFQIWWFGFVTIKISVFGAKMLSSPETPGIGPETPGFENSGRNSGYRPGYSGFGTLRAKLRV